MSTLNQLISPPPASNNLSGDSLHRSLTSTYNSISAMTSVRNDTLLVNCDFNLLGPSGLTPTTQADGDNTMFMDDWLVVGASEASYIITPTVYPANSTVVSGSDHFVNNVVSGYSGDGLYYYQRQPGTVRKYQQSHITWGIQATNNGDVQVGLLFQMIMHLDPSTISYPSGIVFLKPGYNKLTATIKTNSLQGQSVGADNYVEFRLVFSKLADGDADFDLHLLKAEYGQIHTPIYGS